MERRLAEKLAPTIIQQRDRFHRGGEKEKEKKRNKKLLNCSVHLRISIGFARAKIYRGDIYIYIYELSDVDTHGSRTSSDLSSTTPR